MHNAFDYAKIIAISFVGIWLINRTLVKVGLEAFKA